MFLNTNTSSAWHTVESSALNSRDIDRDLPLAGTSSLLALGVELKACVEHPAQVSVGAFAALIERLQGELRLVCGDEELPQVIGDDYAALFLDGRTRELSQDDIGQIEAALNHC